MDWGGEYSELARRKSQLMIIGPFAIFLVFMILFALYGNFKFPATILLERGDDGAGRSVTGAKTDEYTIQRFLGPGIDRSAWRIGGNRDHRRFVHQ